MTYGIRYDLALYRLADGSERIVYARRADGAVRVFDLPFEEPLAVRHLIAADLHRLADLRQAVIERIADEGAYLLDVSALLA
jgi:hypothetical protein